MSLLDKISYAPLQPGQYQVIILDFKGDTVQGVTDKSKTYEIVKFTASILPEGRPISFNMFPVGFDIMIAELRQQLIPATDTANYFAKEILAIAKSNPVDIWISYNTDDNGKTHRNHNFRAPKPIDPTPTVSEF